MEKYVLLIINLLLLVVVIKAQVNMQYVKLMLDQIELKTQYKFFYCVILFPIIFDFQNNLKKINIKCSLYMLKNYTKNFKQKKINFKKIK